MPYTPTNWAKGDIITAERLNKIEQGIQSASSGESNILVVNCNYDTTWDDYLYLDQTLGNIYAAVIAGNRVVINWRNWNNVIVQSLMVVCINNVNLLADTTVEKIVETKDGYYFVQTDPAAYPVISNYWGQ